MFFYKHIYYVSKIDINFLYLLINFDGFFFFFLQKYFDIDGFVKSNNRYFHDDRVLIPKARKCRHIMAGGRTMLFWMFKPMTETEKLQQLGVDSWKRRNGIVLVSQKMDV